MNQEIVCTDKKRKHAWINKLYEQIKWNTGTSRIKGYNNYNCFEKALK